MERNYLSTFRTKNKSFKYEQGHTTPDRKLLPLDRLISSLRLRDFCQIHCLWLIF